jgi:hypothetical protein
MKFEYKTLIYDTKGFFGGKVDEDEFESTINGAAKDGWELINSFPTTEQSGATRCIVLIFRRETKENIQ